MGLSKLDRAYVRAKKSAESLYRDTATIYLHGNGDDSSSAFSDASKQMQVIAENVSVKVVKSNLKTLSGNQASVDSLDAKILMSNDIEVPAGAIFEVVDVNGRKKTYREASSGYTAYRTHQEVAVKFEERR